MGYKDEFEVILDCGFRDLRNEILAQEWLEVFFWQKPNWGCR
jgi:hypothetical protein